MCVLTLVVLGMHSGLREGLSFPSWCWLVVSRGSWPLLGTEFSGLPLGPWDLFLLFPEVRLQLPWLFQGPAGSWWPLHTVLPPGVPNPMPCALRNSLPYSGN